jgi:hypothetical protein
LSEPDVGKGQARRNITHLTQLHFFVRAQGCGAPYDVLRQPGFGIGSAGQLPVPLLESQVPQIPRCPAAFDRVGLAGQYFQRLLVVENRLLQILRPLAPNALR